LTAPTANAGRAGAASKAAIGLRVRVSAATKVKDGRLSGDIPAFDVDARLTEIERRLNLLLNITPVNAAEARADFERSDFGTVPTLRLRPLEFEPDLSHRVPRAAASRRAARPPSEIVRRLRWDWQPVDDVGTAVDDFLREAQVRPWQQELVVPAQSAPLSRRPTTPDEARRVRARRVAR